MTSRKAKVRVENVTKIFGGSLEAAVAELAARTSKEAIFRATGSVVAVADVSFSVGEGEIFVVMGLSGSGKSTLVRCINRLITPTAGTLRIDDQDVLTLESEDLRQLRRDKISMVFQHFALFPHMSVVENVAFGLKLRGLEPVARRERAVQALAMVGLEAWADSPPHNLSGGMQQRVGLARALAVEPEILLMDEPFSALDPLIRREMQGELLRLQAELGITVIFITHDLHEALRLGDQIAIMKDGTFVQIGSPEDIVARPADDYVASFTQDVDRSRVLTVRTAMRPAPTLAAGANIALARAALAENRGAGVFVLDDGGRTLGLLQEADLEQLGRRAKTIDGAARGDFAAVGADSTLAETFDHCVAGRPVAVVDDNGRLTGMVRPLDLFALLKGGDENLKPSTADRPAAAPELGTAHG